MLFKKRTPLIQLTAEQRVCSLKDYDDTYIYIKKVLPLLGLRLMRKDSRLAKIFWDAFYWFGFINLFVAILLDLLLLKELIRNADFIDVTNIFRMLPCIMFMILAMLKTYKIVYQRSVFENLVNELRSMWPEGEVSEEENTVITKSLKEIHFFVKALYYCNYVLVFSISAPPVLELVKRTFGQDIPRVLPYNYWTPYDSSQPGWFEFTLALQSWQTLLTVWCVVIGDLLFCVFLGHITIQFDLLCIRIQRLFYVPVDEQLIVTYPLGEYHQTLTKAEKNYHQSLTAKDRNIKHQKELTEILIRHNSLIRLANDIEDLFGFSLLYNFFCSSIIICFCSFCSVLIEKWNMFMYKIFLMSALSQTWLLCWYGQKLFESSQSVADALYTSGWYTASKEIKRSILIMIHRSQKSVHITTYGFSIICLSSYTAIIKTAWSYFTLLLNFYEQ